MIQSGSDTLVGITERQFDIVLFSFSYLKEQERLNLNASKQITRLDSINTLLRQNLTLERKKSAYKDSISVNLEAVLKKEKKKARKEKLKNTFIQIGLGLGLAVETGVITYLLLK